MRASNPYPIGIKNCRVMVFVDGENLAIRYGEVLGDGKPLPHVRFERGVYVWSTILNSERNLACETLRRHYYTAIRGSEEDRQRVHEALKSLGIEAPRVFPKYKQRGSKRVDISLAVDMLGHAHRKNYDIAILVAGDEDYVPLVDADAAEGRRVALWFLEEGLSTALMNHVDHVFDLGKGVLFSEHPKTYF